MKSYSSALDASRTDPNRAGPIIPAIAAAVMIIRRFVSILAEAGYILRLLARIETHPCTTLQAALQVHSAATPSLIVAMEIVKSCQRKREIPPAWHVKTYSWAFFTVSLPIQ
jgi:hypothetical protein